MLSVVRPSGSHDVAAKSDDKKAVAIIYSDGKRDGDLVCVDDSKPGNTCTPPLVVQNGEHIAVEPSHDPEGRDVVMIGGKSGSGKSFAARNFAIRYHRLYPKRKVRLLSFLAEDRTLDACEFIERVKAEQWANNPPPLKEFDESLTIFDDIEGFEKGNKDIHRALQQTIDMVATTGRHNASSLIVCSHLLTDYKRTRLFLGEAHMYIVFPHGCSMTQLTRLLGGYAGADKKDLEKIRRLPTRWVALRTSFPTMVIHENGVYLLHTEEAPAKSKSVTALDIPDSESDSDSDSDSDESRPPRRHKHHQKKRRMY